jgi:septum formation protein
MKLILGSSSKYRQKVLRNGGIEFDVIKPEIDEKQIRHPDPQELTLLIARAKSDAVIAKLKEPAIVVTSDEVGVADGKLLEKPISLDEARETIKHYFVHPPSFVTSVVVKNTATGKRVEGSEWGTVYFKPIPDDVLEKFLAEGDALNCAGAFTAEDPLLVPYLTFDGGLDCIIGMPLELTKRLIRKVS